jgi:peptidyl-prolyl cis-trans isomerase SurA
MKLRIPIAVLLLASMATAQSLSSHAASPVAGSTVPATTTSLQATGKPVVKVNDATLTDRDLLREMLELFPYARLHNGFPKGQEAEIRRGAMQMIIFEELVYQDALRQNLTIAPARLDLEEKRFREQFDSRNEFLAYLKTEMGGSEAKLRHEIRRSLLIDTLLKAEVSGKSSVSPAEAQAYYDKNPKLFEHSDLFAFQSISFLPPAAASAETVNEARKRAGSALAQAKAAKNYQEFGLLAEKLSEDDYRVNMGDHHAVPRADLPPEVVKAAVALQPGQVSDVLQLGNAFTILRLTAYMPAGRAKFADVKSDLIQKLQKEKIEKLRAALDRRLRQNARIQEM